MAFRAPGPPRKNLYYHIRNSQIVAGPEESAVFFREHWKQGDYLYSHGQNEVWSWSQADYGWLMVRDTEAAKVRLAMLLLL